MSDEPLDTTNMMFTDEIRKMEDEFLLLRNTLQDIRFRIHQYNEASNITHAEEFLQEIDSLIDCVLKQV